MSSHVETLEELEGDLDEELRRDLDVAEAAWRLGATIEEAHDAAALPDQYEFCRDPVYCGIGTYQCGCRTLGDRRLR